LPRAECVKRLRDSTQREWNVFGKGYIVGRIGEESTILYVRRGYQNAFRTILAVTLSDTFEQTRLRCQSRFMHGTTIFMSIWFGGVIVLGGALTVTLLVKAATTQNLAELPAAFVPVLMLALGIGFVWFGRFLARNEKSLLIEFLEVTLEAQRSPVAAPLQFHELSPRVYN
jgi:hypothetical protein